MVSIFVRKKDFLKQIGGAREKELEEKLPLIKCSVEGIGEEEIGFEITSDRPDLLCSEGIARAFKGFEGKEVGAPRMKIGKSGFKMRVEKSVSEVRPFVVCAVVKGIEVTSDYIKELMQLQEKLHVTHGRKRKRVAIGVHNLDVLKPDFVYKAVYPEEVSFVPLGKMDSMNLQEILEKHEKGREYAFTLKGKEKYPIILDGKKDVVSFPPIINNSLTVVTEETKNFFLDITGENFDACNVALNILCQNFCDRGAKIESVEVIYEEGKKIETPVIEPIKMSLELDYVNKCLGTTLSLKQAVELLKKQRIDAKSSGKKIIAEIPRYRSDFIHSIDLVEEIAIAFGLNKFTPKPPASVTTGELSESTSLNRRCRDAMAGIGYLEAFSATLSNERIMKKTKSSRKPIFLSNPVSSDYEIVRPEIAPGLLELLSKNTHADYPQKVFEIGEIVEMGESETGTKTFYSLSAITAHLEADLSEIASVLDAFMKRIGREYYLKKPEKNIERFIPGRQAEVFSGKERIGEIGEVHPEVLCELGIAMPCSLFEIKIREIKY